jgi:[ribosomal protein S18]-alanine N-acetyltransferase
VPPRSHATAAPTIRIRRAVDADRPALVALEHASFTSDRMSARQFRRHLRGSGASVIVAARAKDIVGAAVVFFHASHDIARLYSIAVASSARGVGLGDRLLAAAERAAREHGSASMRLEVRAGNVAARRLYETRGYVAFATKAAYYEDGEDAVRYEKALLRR